MCMGVDSVGPIHLTSETMSHKTANIEDGAHFYIIAQLARVSGKVIDQSAYFFYYKC